MMDESKGVIHRWGPLSWQRWRSEGAHPTAHWRVKLTLGYLAVLGLEVECVS